jgi:hypothetical protein
MGIPLCHVLYGDIGARFERVDVILASDIFAQLWQLLEVVNNFSVIILD